VRSSIVKKIVRCKNCKKIFAGLKGGLIEHFLQERMWRGQLEKDKWGRSESDRDGNEGNGRGSRESGEGKRSKGRRGWG
jgi:hypothetical protein